MRSANIYLNCIPYIYNRKRIIYNRGTDKCYELIDIMYRDLHIIYTCGCSDNPHIRIFANLKNYKKIKSRLDNMIISMHMDHMTLYTSTIYYYRNTGAAHKIACLLSSQR